MHTAESLKTEPVFSWFHRICLIPHGSGNEKALGDMIVSHFMNRENVEVKKDAVGNVYLRKQDDGNGKAPVLLQAHLDMVCQKRDGSKHDFLKDPIRWVVDGDLLGTGGETTLGADDGIGVALALTALESEDPEMPPLEVILTTGEEEDFAGAAGFDPSWFTARRMINLDHVSEEEVLCGSSGGMAAEVTIPVERNAVPPEYRCFTIRVDGLAGGHSGEDIHRGRGSANVLLTRLVYAASRDTDLRILSVRGGTFRLALPYHAECVIALPSGDAERVSALMRDTFETFRPELALSGKNIRLSVQETDGEGKTCISADQFYNPCMLLPDGIFQLNEALEGFVDASDNVGEVILEEEADALRIVIEIRAAYESVREWLFARISRVAQLCGGTCEGSRAYPSWFFNAESELAAHCREVYARLSGGKQMRTLTVHAGLEVGYFYEKGATDDAVSLGPDTWDLHSPTERVSISSVERFYAFLTELLRTL